MPGKKEKIGGLRFARGFSTQADTMVTQAQYLVPNLLNNVMRDTMDS